MKQSCSVYMYSTLDSSFLQLACALLTLLTKDIECAIDWSWQQSAIRISTALEFLMAWSLIDTVWMGTVTSAQRWRATDYNVRTTQARAANDADDRTYSSTKNEAGGNAVTQQKTKHFKRRSSNDVTSSQSEAFVDTSSACSGSFFA